MRASGEGKAMMRTVRVALLLAGALGLGGTAQAAGSDLATTLKGTVEENLRGYNAEDAEATLRAVHKSSPEYDATKAALADQFRDYDIKAELVDFRYLGHDDEFVVARVKTRFVAPAGSGFNDNVVDSLVAFHQDGGVWKLWSDEVLGVQFEAK
jgi:hypothetical protein